MIRTGALAYLERERRRRLRDGTTEDQLVGQGGTSRVKFWGGPEFSGRADIIAP